MTKAETLKIALALLDKYRLDEPWFGPLAEDIAAAIEKVDAAWKKATRRDDPDLLDFDLGRAGIDSYLRVLNERRTKAEKERDELRDWKESALKTLTAQGEALTTMATNLGLKIGDFITTNGVKALTALKADSEKLYQDTARVNEHRDAATRARRDWKAEQRKSAALRRVLKMVTEGPCMDVVVAALQDPTLASNEFEEEIRKAQREDDAKIAESGGCSCMHAPCAHDEAGRNIAVRIRSVVQSTRCAHPPPHRRQEPSRQDGLFRINCLACGGHLVSSDQIEWTVVYGDDPKTEGG